MEVFCKKDFGGLKPLSKTIGTETSTKSAGDFAVGVIIDNSNPDAVARSLLRAKEHADEVYAVHSSNLDQNSKTIKLAKLLDINLISLDSDHDDVSVLSPALMSAAKYDSLPGILIHEDPERWVDYEASEEEFEKKENFKIDAVLKSQKDTEVLVGIPAYNEENSIRDVVTEAKKYSDSVVVVDDGSRDDTANAAREAGAEVIEHEVNKGYGNALKTIFQEANLRQAGHLVILDGDGQHEALDIPRLVKHQKETDSEIVIGSRFLENSETDLPLYRHLGIKTVNVFTNLSLGLIRPSSTIRDTQSGFRAYDSQAISTLAESQDIGDNMGASTDILHHADNHNYDIQEIETTVNYDVGNTSSLHPVTHGLSLIQNLLTTIEKKRPILFLGVPGFFSTFIGLGFGYWTIQSYINTGSFPLGGAISSTFFALAGIFAGFTAIILHSLNQHIDN